MRIIKVSYSALANLGDYQNERVGMTAHLEEGESPEDAIKALKDRVTPLCGPRLQDLRNQQYQLERRVSELKDQLVDYERRWNDAAEFLRTQGIKPDAPNFPQFTNLLTPSITQQDSGVIEGEYDDSEGDEDDEDDDY